MELNITQAFPTHIGRVQLPDSEAMNQGLRTLILAEESAYPSVGRSNIGGWHSRDDFLHRPDANVAALSSWITWALRRIFCVTTGQDNFVGTASICAWATICRAGAYHAPHSHPDSAWSGVYYVDAGAASQDKPLSGVLEFLDPRAGAEAVSAPGDLYGEPFRVRARSGLLVMFPSWLYHWVHPYAGETPRVAISFNATIGASAADKPGIDDGTAASFASENFSPSPY
jgi:uncharacterized protein (TIGR02466 family)